MMFHLPSLLAFWRTVCHPCRAMDAHVDAMVSAALEDDPIYQALEAKFARIDAACADWAREVEALADVELAELIDGERP